MYRKRIYSPEELGKIFDGQIKRLETYGCPVKTIEYFQSRKEDIIEKAFGLDYRENNLPFVLIVPFNIWRMDFQLKALSLMVGDILGKTIEVERGKALKFEISRLKTSEKSPYVIYDVERKKLHVQKKRAFLSLPETIAYLLQREDCLLDKGDVVSMRNGTSDTATVFMIGLSNKESIVIEKVTASSRRNVDFANCWETTPSCLEAGKA